MTRITLAALSSLLATPALAHHPLNGMPMESFAQGLLSGVGHPVLGFDHLFFVVAMGVAAAFTARRFLTPLAYVAAMLAGCLLMAGGVGLPATEAVIAVSLLATGGIVLSGRTLGVGAALAVFAGFGLFHGSAFGGSIAGAEAVAMPVLLGYLLGLGVVQYAIAAVVVMGVRAADRMSARMIGAGVAGLGVFLVLEIAEGPLVAAIAG